MLLLDTGPFISLIDHNERNHGTCVEFFRQYQGELLTTEAVLTETLYLLNDSLHAQQTAIKFITRETVKLIPPSIDSLLRISALLEKYADIPIDYADASLVCLAEDLKCKDIFTLDRHGFYSYRIKGRTPFNVFP